MQGLERVRRKGKPTELEELRRRAVNEMSEITAFELDLYAFGVKRSQFVDEMYYELFLKRINQLLRDG